MAYNIQNSDTIKEIREALRASISEGFPQKVNDTVQIVIPVNPKELRRNNIVKSAASGTVYTTPADKDFYLSAWSLGAESSTAGASAASITVFNDGDTSSTEIAKVSIRVGAALSDQAYDNITQSLAIPIKLARNTAITIATSGAPASKYAKIFGYTVEP